jgi:hypothetical protein
LLLEAKSLKTVHVRSSGSSPLRLDVPHDGQAKGWTGFPVAAQGLYSLKLNHGELSGLSSLRSDSSCDSQMGGWTSFLMAKDAQVRVEKKNLGSQWT